MSKGKNYNKKNNSNQEEKKIKVEERIEEERWKEEQLEKDGKIMLNTNEKKHKIQLLSIIGEIEGHDVLGNNIKSTKYEHILPMLAAIEDSKDIHGVLLLLNTMGGDVEAGLAIAEMISSLSKPTVSLVLGGSHSIGVPIAVSSKYSFIVPTGTMVIHPVRLNGLVIGAQPTYDYFKQMQDRIITFVSKHCNISKKRLETLMMQTGMLTKDVGTILVGKEAVEEGLIDEVGGINKAISKLHEMIENA
ncbi:MAG: ATP-dependent Clp protease proteolytic subunit [Lachnospiraceae bacterium]|nr:ATP-dependent Clp protease proteolytic subunit [Lachnospiraceae bacterium]